MTSSNSKIKRREKKGKNGDRDSRKRRKGCALLAGKEIVMVVSIRNGYCPAKVYNKFTFMIWIKRVLGVSIGTTC